MKLTQTTIFSKPVITSIYLMLIVSTLGAISHYPGTWYIYLAFSVLSNYLLLVGFNKNSIFFDTFIGIFFWLGFWLKATFKLIFSGGEFSEAVGQFDGSGDAFDRAVIVVMIAFVGLLIARWARIKWMFTYREHCETVTNMNLFKFYTKYRVSILVFFVAAFLLVGISNVFFGIYQRGEIPRTVLPYGLNGVYTWLLLFGLASFSALIMRFELVLNNAKGSAVPLIVLLELFVSNVSLLSRGMLLNFMALFYGAYNLAKRSNIKITIKQCIVVMSIFIVLFGSSVIAVNYLRTLEHHERLISVAKVRNEKLDTIIAMTSSLFINRWVGMEGVLAVTSYGDSGWHLFREALRERYSHYETSFYDLNIIDSPYIDMDKTKNHYISLPGAIAFFFYPGSYLFLLASMVMIGLFAAMFEFMTYRLGGKNLILCALISQVIAFRLASFGYVPSQSYLLFGSIFVNLLIIYLLIVIFNKLYKPTHQSQTY